MSDPFDILRVPADFDLDHAALQRAWLRRSLELHPDRGSSGPVKRRDDERNRPPATVAFSLIVTDKTDEQAEQEPEDEPEEPLAELAAVNRARAVLADPMQRAEALLTRLGGASKEADKSLPEGFLMEMLEVREQVEEAARSNDPGEIGKWEKWAEERRRESVASVRALFKAHSNGDPAALGDIRREINAWRYIERLIEQLPSK